MRAALRGLGEACVTAGLVLLLFVVYQLFWTNLEAHRAQDRVADQIREGWDRPPGAPGEVQDRVDFGQGFAFLYVPALGKNWHVPVVQGVGLPDLARGVGHYPKTARPGEVGNFAVAGHRATNGEPFAYLDRVHRGDVVVAETQKSWFTYVVDKTQLVAPTDVWVLDPVPGRPDAKPTRRLVTLTTCNPRWGSSQRLIVFGHLRDQQPKAAGRPTVLRQGGEA